MQSIQRAAPTDVEGILRCKAAGWRTTYAAWVPPDIIEAVATDRDAVCRAIATDLVWVARRTGEIVGFAHVIAAGRAVALLESLHVLPTARGDGIGASLLRIAARELGDEPLEVHVVAQNHRAIALYERLGARLAASDVPAPWAPDAAREVHLRWGCARPLSR